MARGIPALWSALLSVPFLVVGGYVYANPPADSVPASVGIPFVGFGVFVLVFGVYIHFVAAPSPPRMRENEEVIDTRNPAQRAAIAKALVGFVFLVAAGYLLFFTFQPYVYPTVALALGLYLFSTGLFTYWTNTLTTYYVTNQRIIKEYRFISLTKQEIPFTKVRGVEENKSIWEAFVGLGNVRVASGGGGALEITVTNVYGAGKFADEIRNLV